MIPQLSERAVGLLWITLSAAGFGSMAIFAKFAYADGVSLSTLLFLRFSIAGALLVAIMTIARLRWPRGRSLLALMLMGAIGYVGQSYCYFASLKYASAGVTALLLYLYPALVSLLGWWILRRPLSTARAVALVLALAGCAMTVAGAMQGTAPGIMLGLAAALIYATYILIGERVTRGVGSVQSSAVVILSAAAVYGGAWLAEGGGLPQTAAGWIAASGIALFSTVLAILGFFAGLSRLGAADASTASTLEPVTTIVLAAIFLGESLSPLQWAGGAIILVAVVLIARQSPPPAG